MRGECEVRVSSRGRREAICLDVEFWREKHDCHFANLRSGILRVDSNEVICIQYGGRCLPFIVFVVLLRFSKKLLRAKERPATLIMTVTSGLRITRARHAYNGDTETGNWKFFLQLRTIRMRKMCQSQLFVTWDTGCRLLSHGRSKYVDPSFCYSRSNFRWKKIKTQRSWKMCFFSSLEFELGTYINLYSFESSMKWPFIKSLITQNGRNKNLFTNWPWLREKYSLFLNNPASSC